MRSSRRACRERTVAIYHDLPPSHHYLAAYRWLDADSRTVSGAHAVVHLGKHGNRWLPGKTLGMSILRMTPRWSDLPLIYLQLTTSGEAPGQTGAHAALVDH